MIFVLYNRSTFPAMIVWASAAVSLDGYIDDTTSRRLVLSGTKDWEQVRALRAECDAVLVGAETIRKDNPAVKNCAKNVRRKASLPTLSK